MSGAIPLTSAALQEFWTERHLCTLTTLRADGSPHVVAVGATLHDGVARVISSSSSAHVRHIRAGAARVAICQVDGPRWSTVEGLASVDASGEGLALAERLYAARYRLPRPNPSRVAIVVDITRVLGANSLRPES
ncbi:pyridoxamine 5'-phosphate oxidase family protein [Actinoplanes sp. NPDC049265]|uniref:pyridoxamine 5'-phosphate oxidase family protein n=1 Tax=Actinoplanes sp. NPDC049265 TaxID=3363902 RepID=UPI003711A754